jgi:ABC-type transport system substrate-binding protein
VDRITFIVYPSEDIAQALLSLQSGAIYSYDERIPYQSVPELEANPAIEVTSELGKIYRQFTLNCARFPTNITGYRRALAHSLNKYAVVANARGGFAQVMDNPIPLAFDFWTYENQMTSHFYHEDIISANATLDAAHIIDTPDSPHPGWRYYDADMSGSWTVGDKRGDVEAPDGLKIDLIVSAGYDPAIQSCLVQVAGMEKCGLQGEVVERCFDCLISCIGEDCYAFNLGCFSWSIDPPGDPLLLYEMFHSESGTNSFFYKYNNSEFDNNCTQFLGASTCLEARNWAWNCCRILMEEMPMIVCYNDEYTHAYRTDIWEGYVPQYGINRMGGNPYTFQQIRLKETAGGPFGCYPTDYVTVLSEGMDYTNTLRTASGYSHTIFDLIYSRLSRVDPLDPQSASAPDLAYDWTLTPTSASGDIQEGMKYTFSLYENITWQDGTPFTAEDVQYSFVTIHPWGTYTWKDIDSIYRVDTPDDYTVEIYSNNTGYVTFTEATSIQILPKHIWSLYETMNFSWDPETPNDLTGTGCYRWNTRVTGQYIILDRYDDWHFRIEHPERRPCPDSRGPSCYYFIFALLIVIIIQIGILIALLRRRRKRAESKAKESVFP